MVWFIMIIMMKRFRNKNDSKNNLEPVTSLLQGKKLIIIDKYSYFCTFPYVSSGDL